MEIKPAGRPKILAAKTIQNQVPVPSGVGVPAPFIVFLKLRSEG